MNKKSKMIAAVMLLAVSAAGLILINYHEQRMHPGQMEPQIKPESPGEQVNYTANYNYSCGNFTGIEKAKCYIEEGDLNKSLELCNNLSGDDGDECYGRLAIQYAMDNSSSDVLMCDKVHDSDAQAFCYSNIAAITVKNNLTRAKEICNKSDPAELCYSGIARVFARENMSKSIGICKSIDDSDECYISLASIYMKENMSTAIEICGNVSSCREMLAPKAAESNPDTGAELCGGYPCLMDVAQVTAEKNVSKAIEICRTIGHPVPRAQCEYFILPQVLENQPQKLEELCGDIIPAWDDFQELKPYCNISK